MITRTVYPSQHLDETAEQMTLHILEGEQTMNATLDRARKAFEFYLLDYEGKSPTWDNRSEIQDAFKNLEVAIREIVREEIMKTHGTGR